MTVALAPDQFALLVRTVAHEVAQRLAGLGREIRVVRGTARRVELHAARFAVRVDESTEEARTVHAHLASRERARDRREALLLMDPVFVPREPDRREGADDEEEGGHDPHDSRIGTGPDSLDGACGSEPQARSLHTRSDGRGGFGDLVAQSH